MGIGISLATGLVQGFTKNIQEEKAMRLGEQTKLDDMTKLVANAALTAGDDFNAAAAQRIEKMIAAAQGKIDDRERINIFGEAGPRVNTDFTSVLGTLANTAQQGSQYLIGSDFDLLANNSKMFRSRFSKDMGDPGKKAGLVLDGLHQYRMKVGDEAFKNTFSSDANRNALRREYTSSVMQFYKGDPNDPSAGKKVFAPGTDINGYDFMKDFLGLDMDAELQSQAGVAKENFVTAFNREAAPGTAINDTNLSVIRAFDDPDKLLVFDMSALAAAPSLLGMDPVTVEDIDFLAQSQGRHRDVFMVNFSSMYTDESSLAEGLAHASNLAKVLRRGDSINFTSLEGMIAAGEYLDKNVSNPEDQVRIVEGMIGTILTPMQQQSLAFGLATKDQFKAGSNRNEGFKSTYGEGTSYAQFKERVDAARKAQEQLISYQQIVGDITTVKDTFLDNAFAFVESFFGAGGNIEQLTGLVTQGGNFKDGTNEESIKRNALTYMDQLKREGGERAKRDALAFIIAAQMARAEDSAGRLSDGDLQRNLEKLTGRGFRTKVGEAKAIAVVKGEIDSLLKTLGGIELMVESPDAAQGFGIDLRLKIQGLRTRDLMLRKHNERRVASATTTSDETAAVEVSAADILAGATGVGAKYSIMPRYGATSGSGIVYVDNLSGSTDEGPMVYILSNDGETVLHAGRKSRLMSGDVPVLKYIQSGSQAATTPQSGGLTPGSSAAVDGNTLTVTGSATRALTDDTPLGSGTAGDYQQNTQPGPLAGETPQPAGDASSAALPAKARYTVQDLLDMGINPRNDVSGNTPKITIKGIEGTFKIQMIDGKAVYVRN